MTSQNSFSSIT